jgi:hypothetical protein
MRNCKEIAKKEIAALAATSSDAKEGGRKSQESKPPGRD